MGSIFTKRIDRRISLEELEDGRLQLDPISSNQSLLMGLAMCSLAPVILCTVLVITTNGNQGVTGLVIGAVLLLVLGTLWGTYKEHILFDGSDRSVTRTMRILGKTFTKTLVKPNKLECVAVDGIVMTKGPMKVWRPILILVLKNRSKIHLDEWSGMNAFNTVGPRIADHLGVEFHPGREWEEVRLRLGSRRVEVEYGAAR